MENSECELKIGKLRLSAQRWMRWTPEMRESVRKVIGWTEEEEEEYDGMARACLDRPTKTATVSQEAKERQKVRANLRRSTIVDDRRRRTW